MTERCAEPKGIETAVLNTKKKIRETVKTMEYKKLLIKIGEILKVEYEKIAEVNAELKNKEILSDLEEMISKQAVQEIDKLINRELGNW